MNRGQIAGYVCLLAACLVVGLAAGWSVLGAQFDNDVYDFLFRIHAPRAAAQSAVILGMDEETFSNTRGGVRAIRTILAEGLERIAAAGPAAVVIDVTLADTLDEKDAAEDQRLAAAFARSPNLVLAATLVPRAEGIVWELPRPAFAQTAAALAHVHAQPDRYDNVLREIPLEEMDGSRRLWALSLEAFRLYRKQDIVEDQAGIDIGETRIAARRADRRRMLIRYLRPREDGRSAIPQITFHALRQNPALARQTAGKVVFVGRTDIASGDRQMTPFSNGLPMAGVEIHASAFETMVRGDFLRRVPEWVALAMCVLFAAAAGFAFWNRSGWPAYVIAGAVLLLAHVLPYAAFANGFVFPYAPPFSTAWLAVVSAATYQHFFVRRVLRRTTAEKERYQKAIHFVAHEMRTPLTAIQGSSELMGRYKLPEEKRAEMAQMINAESKRLARMIQTFLDVERLSEGQMELKRDPFTLLDVVATCLGRVRPLADRKNISITCEPVEGSTILGDRELMEYAIYNLLTNAVKYSPAETHVTVSSRFAGGHLHLAVRDQGIGMDEKELGNIFRKFYRTKKAEASGEAGTGIGLSIVEQIVSSHGGRIEVSSSPGAGSCFTIVVPASVPGHQPDPSPVR